MVNHILVKSGEAKTSENGVSLEKVVWVWLAKEIRMAIMIMMTEKDRRQADTQ